VDNRQAKEILWLYRPGVDDADPQFAEALEYAKQHPEIQQWLDEQCALYNAVRARIKDIPVPGDLPRQILGERGTLPRVVWWRRPFAVGAAAVIVIGLSLYWILSQVGLLERRPSPPRADFAAFRSEMVDFAATSYGMDVRSPSLDVLRQQFASKGWPADYAVPAGVAKLAVRGGCLTKWNDHKVSMLCLMGPRDHKVWLLVVARSALPDPPLNSTPQIATENDINTACWSAGNNTYLFAAEGDEDFLRSLL
jgi:hypothetical protein